VALVLPLAAAQQFRAYLSKKYVDEAFAFYGTALRGIAQNRPRWKRGVGLVDGAIVRASDAHVAKYFPPESKKRMDELVGTCWRVSH